MLANIVLHVPTQNVLTVRVKELKKKHHQHRRFFSNTFFSPMHVHILKQEEIRQEPELMQNLAGPVLHSTGVNWKRLVERPLLVAQKHLQV